MGVVVAITLPEVLPVLEVPEVVAQVVEIQAQQHNQELPLLAVAVAVEIHPQQEAVVPALLLFVMPILMDQQYQQPDHQQLL
ncbi:MAG: hypothetical protein EBY29_10915 [Planctomycetes bacterium]|nr:hypothetical protein [Planctomycetota bacterium]